MSNWLIKRASSGRGQLEKYDPANETTFNKQAEDWLIDPSSIPEHGNQLITRASSNLRHREQGAPRKQDNTSTRRVKKPPMPTPLLIERDHEQARRSKSKITDVVHSKGKSRLEALKEAKSALDDYTITEYDGWRRSSLTNSLTRSAADLLQAQAGSCYNSTPTLDAGKPGDGPASPSPKVYSVSREPEVFVSRSIDPPLWLQSRSTPYGGPIPCKSANLRQSADNYDEPLNVNTEEAHPKSKQQSRRQGAKTEETEWKETLHPKMNDMQNAGKVRIDAAHGRDNGLVIRQSEAEFIYEEGADRKFATTRDRDEVKMVEFAQEIAARKLQDERDDKMYQAQRAYRTRLEDEAFGERYKTKAARRLEADRVACEREDELRESRRRAETWATLDHEDKLDHQRRQGKRAARLHEEKINARKREADRTTEEREEEIEHQRALQRLALEDDEVDRDLAHQLQWYECEDSSLATGYQHTVTHIRPSLVINHFTEMSHDLWDGPVVLRARGSRTDYGLWDS